MPLPLRIPAARTEDIVVSHVGNDVIVFDQLTNQIHHLDATCSAVWSVLDVERTIPEIMRLAGISNPEVTESAVSRIAEAGLLDIETGAAPAQRTITRRRIVTRTAAAASVPVIVSVTAPLAAMAASPGGPCSPNGTFAPSPDCCNVFLTCDNGYYVARFCAPGTTWNQELTICDWSNQVDCGGKPIC